MLIRSERAPIKRFAKEVPDGEHRADWPGLADRMECTGEPDPARAEIGMSKLNLSIAIGDYDRVRPLVDGSVQIDGVDPVFMLLEPEEIFFRAFRHADFEKALSANFSPDAIKGIVTPADDLNGDIHASAEYRAHLIGVVSKRAVAKAV